MNTPIIVDPEDPKWLLLEQVMNMTASRAVKQAMARQGMVPLEKAGTILRILFISIYFSIDITYLLQELEKRSALRNFAHVAKVPSAAMIYQFLSNIEEDQFIWHENGHEADGPQAYRMKMPGGHFHIKSPCFS